MQTPGDILGAYIQTNNPQSFVFRLLRGHLVNNVPAAWRREREDGKPYIFIGLVRRDLRRPPPSLVLALLLEGGLVSLARQLALLLEGGLVSLARQLALPVPEEGVGRASSAMVWNLYRSYHVCRVGHASSPMPWALSSQPQMYTTRCLQNGEAKKIHGCKTRMRMKQKRERR